MAKRDRRQDILLAARKVFAEEGYREAKVGNIAAEAGVAKGTVYLHLADKRSIFVELTDTLFLRLGETILKVDTDGDVPSQVQHNIRTFISAPGRSRLGVDGVQPGWTESTENDGGRRPKSTCDQRFRNSVLEACSDCQTPF